MPLIVITGYPSSGKTYRAHQLVSLLKERIADSSRVGTRESKITIFHIPSYHSFASHGSINENFPSRDSIYNSTALEKTARAAELSAIKRALSNGTIVIADDLNYIKGFRYQIWCEAKAAGTRCCTVHCAAREDEVAKWNRSRLRQWAELKGERTHDGDWDTTTTGFHVSNDGDAGDILPVSHTDIYGDRVPDIPARSRSSSMDASDGEDTGPCRRTAICRQLNTSLSSTPSNIDAIDLPGLRLVEPSLATTTEFPPPNSPPYSQKTLQSLVMRYEPPSPFSKWDTPLFTVPACDPQPPAAAIWDALFSAGTTSIRRKDGTIELEAAVKPHAATVLPQPTGADALQFLEKTTADVVTQVMGRIKAQPDLVNEGGTVEVIIGDTVATLTIPMGTILTLPVLQRMRRRFTQIQKGGIAHGRGYVKGEKAVGEAFVRFLDVEIGGC